jgi:hypothetical protein
MYANVGLLYFGPFSSFHNSPLSLYLPPPIFQQLSVHILISSTITSYVMKYYWCSIKHMLFSHRNLKSSISKFEHIILFSNTGISKDFHISKYFTQFLPVQIKLLGTQPLTHYYFTHMPLHLLTWQIGFIS